MTTSHPPPPPPNGGTPERTFHDFLHLLHQLHKNERPQIMQLTKCAEHLLTYHHHHHYHKKAIEAVASRISSVGVDTIMPSFYLLDSIAKNIGGAYLPAIESLLVPLFSETFERSPATIRSQLSHMLRTWGAVFSKRVHQTLGERVAFIQGNVLPPRMPKRGGGGGGGEGERGHSDRFSRDHPNAPSDKHPPSSKTDFMSLEEVEVLRRRVKEDMSAAIREKRPLGEYTKALEQLDRVRGYHLARLEKAPPPPPSVSGSSSLPPPSSPPPSSSLNSVNPSGGEPRAHPRDLRMDSRDPRGGNPNHPRDARVSPNHPRDNGGNPNHPRVNGGNPNHPRDNGGNPNHPRDNGGNPNHPRDTRGNPNHPRDTRGNPGDARGLRVDPRDLRADPRDLRMDSRNPGGADPRELGGHLRDPRGGLNHPRDTRGNPNHPRDTRVNPNHPRNTRGNPNHPRDTRVSPNPRDARANPREARGNLREARANPRDARANLREVRGNPRDARVNPREERNHPGEERNPRERNYQQRQRTSPPSRAGPFPFPHPPLSSPPNRDSPPQQPLSFQPPHPHSSFQPPPLLPLHPAPSPFGGLLPQPSPLPSVQGKLKSKNVESFPSWDDLKTPRPFLVKKLYDVSQYQCGSCGLRFPKSEKLAIQAHLDWHFKVNSKGLLRRTTVYSRQWFLEEEEWFAYGGQETPEVVSKPFLEEEIQEEKPKPRVRRGENGNSTPSCPSCLDEVDSEFDSNEDDWFFIDAVQFEAKVYHSDCLPLPSPTPPPNNKRKKEKEEKEEIPPKRVKIESMNDQIAVF